MTFDHLNGKIYEFSESLMTLLESMNCKMSIEEVRHLIIEDKAIHLEDILRDFQIDNYRLKYNEN